MANFKAVYRPRDDGDFDLMMVFSQEYLEQDGVEDWLENHAALAFDPPGKIIEGDCLADFPDVYVERKPLNYDAWVEKYKPQKNHLDHNASFDGTMYETRGEEFAYVQDMDTKDPNRVWTILEGDNDETVITNGLHFINRLGYIITEVPFTESDFLEIVDD